MTIIEYERSGFLWVPGKKSALYPNATWEDCLEFIRTIDSFKLKSVSYMEVAKRYGLSSTTTKSFTSKISSSKQYGLITTSNGNTIQLTENSMKLLYPTGNDSRELALECFSSPPILRKVNRSLRWQGHPQ